MNFKLVEEEVRTEDLEPGTYVGGLNEYDEPNLYYIGPDQNNRYVFRSTSKNNTIDSGFITFNSSPTWRVYEIGPPSVSEVEKEVRRLANKNWNKIYKRFMLSDDRLSTCKYSVDNLNDMGCIFGAAFRNLGFSIDDRIDTIDSITEELYGSPWNWGQLVQIHQDAGTSWGIAVSTADRLMEQIISANK